uniref:Peptidase M23 domain-containing protein n=1 Tax=Lysobacter sp. RH2180-5 TaxID=1809648 RepID=A0A1B4ZA46_9GAMM|nr:hypothetical protein [Lysobacter sp. RH2180-5]
MSAGGLGFWLLQAGAQVLAGALAWSAGSALHRALRISHAAFGYWLALWLLAVAPTAAALLWHALGEAAPRWPLPAALPLPALEAFAATGADSAATAPRAADTAPVLDLPLLLMALYLAGATWQSLRWLRATWAVRRLARAALPAGNSLPGSHSRAEQARLRERGIELRLSATATTAFALGWPQRAVIVPARLVERLDDRQLALVLRHEAAHLRRRDPERAALMAWVQAALWFNPFLSALAARVQLAAELRCDAIAVDADDAHRRRYAQAYLNSLRLAAERGAPAAATAFARRRGPSQQQLRMQHLLHGDDRARLGRGACAALLGLALCGGGAFAAVQAAAGDATTGAGASAAGSLEASAASGAANARSADPGSANRNRDNASTDAADAGAAFAASRALAPAARIELAAPLAQARISSRYGVTGGIRVRPHRGLDFHARRGTTVYAPAAATVVAATARYPEGAQYGKVVVLDHGDGWQTLYAHLQDFQVREGQRIAAGAPIGRSGATGKVTGPHLHMEALHQGQRVDPEPLLR